MSTHDRGKMSVSNLTQSLYTRYLFYEEVSITSLGLGYEDLKVGASERK